MNNREMAEELFEYMNQFVKGPMQRIQNVSKGELAILNYLACRQGETIPSELSSSFQLSTARVANTLNSLERKGYISRVHDKTDRRKVLVFITDEGRAVESMRHEEVIEGLENLLNKLGEEDSGELMRIFRKIKGFYCK